MPRRPRPASRQDPKALRQSATEKSKLKPIPQPKSTQNGKRKLEQISSHQDSEDEDEDEDDFIQVPRGGDDSDIGPGTAVPGSEDDLDEDEEEEEEEEEEDIDLDAPRVSQWVDEDEELDGAEEEEDADLPTRKSPIQDIDKLQDDLSSLPLGALRKAQRVLAQAQADSSDSSEGEEDSDADGFPEEQDAAEDSDGEEDAPKKNPNKVEWSNTPRDDIPKRASKTAPVEVTSKRPVTRRMKVVEIKSKPRDPRFTSSFHPTPTTSTHPSHDAEHFTKAYAFLTTARSSELKTLSSSLATATKLLANSPRDLRAEREAEVERLTQALRRMQGLVNKDKRDAVERKALEKVKQSEREKAKEGKKQWFMKDGERREVLAKARLEAVEEEGGKRAVRRVIERKTKKAGQKEKRSRPWVGTGGSGGGRAGGFGGGGTGEVGGEGERGGRRKVQGWKAKGATSDGGWAQRGSSGGAGPPKRRKVA
ncbi:hypothetical protein BDV98DRAFT_606570 [Pterulicium gracile]|uniref:rRNA biogenesis protein RRP36 n=1 Tax=Pterulicium gracile TaxID=1884261 RepID=A0A5C3QCA7_9AGAR|nr:hypothetical protein BDV98DRAFT_606570 [Pterula gracilis]